jgi:hypothetical protein
VTRDRRELGQRTIEDEMADHTAEKTRKDADDARSVELSTAAPGLGSDEAPIELELVR